MTKYELSRTVGVRAAQLASSSPVLIEVPEAHRENMLYVAARELKERRLEVVIRRPLPNNRFVDIPTAEMEMPPDLDTLLSTLETRAFS